VARGDVDRAARALEGASYRRLGPAREAAWRAWRATHASGELVRTDREPFRVELRWPAALPAAAARLLAPNAPDLDAVRLPAALWPAYSAVRLARLPFRLLGRGLRARDLGPFLATPDALVVPLLRFAGVGPADRVVDLGCGDGRIPIRAAQAFGCTARGIETDARLVAAARTAVADAGLDGRVEIVHGDAARAPLDDATVVTAFLPVATIEELLPSILARLRPGARLVAHEQVRLRAPGARSAPLLSPGGISVAHRWDR
jgi:SAM-dependent methyltransferase